MKHRLDSSPEDRARDVFGGIQAFGGKLFTSSFWHTVDTIADDKLCYRIYPEGSFLIFN